MALLPCKTGRKRGAGIGRKVKEMERGGAFCGKDRTDDTPPVPFSSSCCLLNRKSHNSERSLDSYTRADITIPCATRIRFLKKMCLHLTPIGRWS